jgi:hypothetical protein
VVDDDERYLLDVKGFETIENLDFGIRNRHYGMLDAEFGLFGFVFDDRDGDGAVGNDECALAETTLFPAVSYPGLRTRTDVQERCTDPTGRDLARDVARPQ